VHRELGLVQRLGNRRVGEPSGQRRLVGGVHGGGVEVDALAVGGDDGQRRGVGVEGEVVAHHGKAEALTGAVLGEPGGQRSALQGPAADVEALLDLRIGGGQRVEQPVAQDAELQVVEESMDLVAVPRHHPQRVGGVRQRNVLDQLGQVAVEDDVGEVGAQRLSDLALDGVDLVDERLQ
jgi:hypothetical protein